MTSHSSRNLTAAVVHNLGVLIPTFNDPLLEMRQRACTVDTTNIHDTTLSSRVSNPEFWAWFNVERV